MQKDTRRKEIMKEITELNFPEDLSYTKEHEWIRSLDGDTVRVGITDYAQDQLGDIVFVDLPQVGDTFKPEEEFATVESVKAVSEVYMPINGEIMSVNAALEDSPELLNTDPYGEGWIVEIKPDDLSELDGLMSKDAYIELLQEES
jgi:glycine cleavage system H protein